MSFARTKCWRPLLAATALTIAMAAPAHGFGVDGGRVDLTPSAPGGVIDLGDMRGALAAAVAAPDSQVQLEAVLRAAPSALVRRAAFAWVVVNARDPETAGPAAFAALINVGVAAPRALWQAALFAIAYGAAASDLAARAAAVGLAGPALDGLRRMAGAAPATPWRATLETAPPAGAAAGG